MKQLAFVLISAGLLTASPAIAQGAPGLDFVEAVKKSDGDKAIGLLRDHPTGIVDTKDGGGNTGLIIAVQQHEVPIVKQLLERGANPDKADNAAGYSARDYAARDSRARDILKLIEEKKPKAAAAASK